jgi:hypothetical protein
VPDWLLYRNIPVTGAGLSALVPAGKVKFVVLENVVVCRFAI